jgi:hypothetical protein
MKLYRHLSFVSVLALGLPTATADDTSFTNGDAAVTDRAAESPRVSEPTASDRNQAQLQRANEALQEEISELYTINKDLTEKNKKLAEVLEETRNALELTRAELAEQKRINVEILEEVDGMLAYSESTLKKVNRIAELEEEVVQHRPVNLKRRPTRTINKDAVNAIARLEREVFLSVTELNTRCQQLLIEYGKSVDGGMFSRSGARVE